MVKAHFLLDNLWIHQKYIIAPTSLHFKSSYTIFTVRKQSCRKVMFLHLSVSHSVHGGCITACTGQTPLLDRHTLLGRHPPPRPVHAGIHTPLPNACWDTHTPAQCMLWYILLPNACWDTHTPGIHPSSQDDHCSGWYTSYWNAILYIYMFKTSQ